MASLHSAFRSLGPVDFSEIPQSPQQLDEYLHELYADAQAIVESIPIADPDTPDTRPRAATTNSIASNASQMSASSARSTPPAPEFAALQKEWGKPLRLNKSENQLGISVYKTSGKDSRGAWFARRSVHEGLGFARFRKAFEKEFPTSLEVQGGPGEGNVRGIGAESKAVSLDVPHRGKIEVYRLTAQFPGPTTPRDFVTLLATSSRALKHGAEAGHVPELAPRHYMIISKPCNHPETQPRDGFIRGQYESVEFIREIPRKLKTSHSSANLGELAHKHGHNLEQDLLIRNAAKHPHFLPQDSDRHHLRVNTSGVNSREPSPSGRKRSHTVNVAESPARSHDGPDDYDPEENPVEWIMVTRSDPGGSVPRFLVERGTPASICADAVKFLDWACGLQDSDSPETPMQHPKAFRRESFTSWQESQSKGQLKEVHEGDEEIQTGNREDAVVSPSSETDASSLSPASPQYKTPHTATEKAGSPTIFSSVAGVFSSYAPQAVLNHLPQAAHPTNTTTSTSESLQLPSRDNEDAESIISSTSFASADSHPDWLESTESNSITSHSLHESQASTKDKAIDPDQPLSQHEKELTKLSARRAQLDAKFAQTKTKLVAAQSSATEKEASALKKAEERYEKEVKRHQEKYERELERIEERQKKEKKKMEDRKKKQDTKDEVTWLKRDNAEFKEKLRLMEDEREVWIRQVGDLQKENTSLIARIGRLEADAGINKLQKGAVGVREEQRSRSSSVLGRKKAQPLDRVATGLGSEASGLKSDSSSLTQGS